MTYEEECKLRSQMFAEVAEGVQFQIDESGNGDWVDVEKPMFQYNIKYYRRKPIIVEHKCLVAWMQRNDVISARMFSNIEELNEYLQAWHLTKVLRVDNLSLEIEK